jgi:hypothetical protein
MPDLGNEVERVRMAMAELRRPRVDPAARLNALSDETKRLMNPLLEEEFPEDSQLIRLCGACLGVLRDTVAAPRATERMLLHRTCSPEARCEHAGDDTVLGVYPWFAEWSEDFPVGLCRVGVANEERRRNAGLTSSSSGPSSGGACAPHVSLCTRGALDAWSRGR